MGCTTRTGRPAATIRQCAILLDRPGSAAPGLARLIRELVRFGVADVLLLAEAPSVLRAEVASIQAALPRPVRIGVSETPAGAGTGGALHHARGLLGERFLLCEGGCTLDFNLARLLADAATQPGPRTVRRGSADHVQGDTGVHLLDGSVMDRLSPVSSLEMDLFRETVVPPGITGFSRPALFLDRDGTINRDHGWVGTRNRWEWVDGAVDAVCAATEAGWHVFVVTNQSGIARGYYDEAALDALHGWMTEEIRRAGGTVDDIRFCPFHEDAAIGRYRQASDWRKPAPGMILDLIARWRLDPARCVLVGDQPSDLAAAAAAGIRGRHFGGGSLLATVAPLLRGESA